MKLTGFIRYKYGRAAGTVRLIHRCVLWQCSQQPGPIRLESVSQTLQVGSVHTDGGCISWTQISTPHPEAHSVSFPVHPAGVALLCLIG